MSDTAHLSSLRDELKFSILFNVSSATEDRWLKSWVGRLLRQEEYGYYDKVDKVG